jgi:hypothetical protein
MADDVKVKFSGDFSDVPKGATTAASAAGTAISSQFQSLATSITSSLGSMFAATAIFDKLKEGVSGAREYFSELNRAIRTTGGGGDEFQRVAGLGKSVGVGMEVVARSVGLFSKYIGLASKDVKGHGKVLTELGFTNEQIASGNITATEALAALAKQLEETGNENLVAANATIIFGRAGRELLPIIQKGSSAITEQSSQLKTYSEAELQAAAASERAAERRTAAWKKFFKFLSLELDEREVVMLVGESIREKTSQLQSKGVDVTTPEGRRKLEASIIKDLQAKGIGLEAAQAGAAGYARQLNSTPGLAQGVREGIMSETNSLIEAMKKVSADLKETKPSEKLSTSSVAALSVSSLQAIGGGDISSIFGGTYQDTMLSQTSRIADAAVQTAANTQPMPYRQPSPTPATK